MVKLIDFIGPGTAGVAQRIATDKEKYSSKEKFKYRTKEFEELEILKYHKIMACGHNQF